MDEQEVVKQIRELQKKRTSLKEQDTVLVLKIMELRDVLREGNIKKVCYYTDTYGLFCKVYDIKGDNIYVYVLNDMSALKFEDWLSFEDKHIQPITETQRMILFDALAKEGKYWDAEKKQVIDVKLEIKLQPFDKVLVRDSEDREWRISLFGYKDNSYYYCINGYSWKQCIPYEGNEHLLGTTLNNTNLHDTE